MHFFVFAEKCSTMKTLRRYLLRYIYCDMRLNQKRRAKKLLPERVKLPLSVSHIKSADQT
jgi:hypothetical protein